MWLMDLFMDLVLKKELLHHQFPMILIILLSLVIFSTANAIYAEDKEYSIIDALIDVIAALALLFFAKSDLVMSLIIISVYVFVSGIIDLFHGFLSTVDPTDRFIRLLAGVLGCIMGVVIINAGSFEVMTFIRFFGVYMIIVGVTSMIYGVHNRSQNIEDKVARKENKRKSTRKTAKKGRK